MKTRVAVVGCGFWSRFQIPAWQEFSEVEVIAAVSRNIAHAEDAASRFSIPRVYDRLEGLFEDGGVDVVDLITAVEAHRPQVEACASAGIPVICQKPMADSLEDCRAMVDACRRAGVWFGVHENWRYQAPFRRLAEILGEGVLGEVFRARLSFRTSFDVYANQPFLKEVPRFILADVGSHVFDTARALFGEFDRLACATRRTREDVAGEDVATALLWRAGLAVEVELSYASRMEHERFPQTFAEIEGTRGSLELRRDGEIRVTDGAGTRVERAEPKAYAWADPEYLVVHSSIVDCHRDLLEALRGGRSAPTSGEDNLRTMEIVYGAYEAAKSGEIVRL